MGVALIDISQPWLATSPTFINTFFTPDVEGCAMHALWEVANKADIYEAYKGYKAFIERP